MNITTKTLLAGCASLLIASCNSSTKSDEDDKGKDSAGNATPQKKSEAEVEPVVETAPPNFVKGTVSNQQRLSLDIDFENEAGDQINKENYKEKLDAFEKKSGDPKKKPAVPAKPGKSDE